MNANHDPFAHVATKEALATVASRLDATLPHLATKADVKEATNRLLMWLIGTLLTCLLTFYGLHSSMMDRLTSIQQQQLQEQRMLTSEMRQQNATVEKRLERLEAQESAARP